MSLENINNHQVFQIVQQIKTRLSQEDTVQIQMEHKEFIFDAISFFESRIKKSIPSLIRDKNLTQLQSNFQNVLNEINAFFVIKNYGHIYNAVSYLETIVTIVNQLPIIIPQQIDDLFVFINNFKSVIETERSHILKSTEEVQKTLTEIKNQITTTQQNLTNVQTQNKNLISSFKNEFNQLKENLIKDIEGEKNKLIEGSENIIKKLNDKLEESKKIVNIIGNIGVTGGYQKYAEYHKKQANLWRWISIGFMTSSVIYLAVTVNHLGKYEWHISLLRILSTLLFLYPAQYAANQSSKHREQEIYNNKMELDLAAINPFIELFDDEKKREIKEKLVEKYFSNDLITNKSESEIPVSIYEKIINQIAHLIKYIKH